MGDLGLIPGLGRSPGGVHGNPFQHSFLENPHRQRSLVGYSLWSCKESDTTERLSTASTKQFSKLLIEETIFSPLCILVSIPWTFKNKLEIWVPAIEIPTCLIWNVLCSLASNSLWPYGPCGPSLARLLCPWDFPGKNIGVGRHLLLQGIFPIQGLNPCLPHLLHWQADSVLLSHWESPLLWDVSW